MNATRQRRQEAIHQRTDEMLKQYGDGVDGRAAIVLALMAEFGISDQSAIQHFSLARKRAAGLKAKRTKFNR